MDNQEKKHSNILLKSIYYCALIAIVGTIIFGIKIIFGPLSASVVLSFILSPVVNFFETRGFNRTKVIIAIYLILVGIALATFIFVVPRLISEVLSFAQQVPYLKKLLIEQIYQIQTLLQAKFPQFQIPDLLPLIVNRIPGSGHISIDILIQDLSSFFTLMSLVVIVPFITFFLISEGHLIQKMILSVIPNAYFEMSILLCNRVVAALKDFIRGQIIDASAVACMTSIGLAIIGLPYCIVIGIIAGIGNLVPYLGPIIGFIPALIVLLMSTTELSILSLVSLVLVFSVVQFLEGSFIYPIVVGKSVKLHPLFIIAAVTIGGQLGGVLGMILIIPFISIIKVSFSVFHNYLKSYSII